MTVQELKNRRAEFRNANAIFEAAKSSYTDTNEIYDLLASLVSAVLRDTDEWKALKELCYAYSNTKDQAMVLFTRALIILAMADFEDKEWELECPHKDGAALIYASYAKRQFEVRNDLPGIYKYANWLPICRTLDGSGAPVTYKSEGLA